MTRKSTGPLAWAKRQAAAALIASRNAPLFVTTTTVSLAVDVFAWGGLFTLDKPTANIAGFTFSLAWPEAVLSTCMTIAAILLTGAAAAQKADQRRDQRKRAGATQALAMIVLCAPVFYAGQCLAVNDMRAERDAYVGSDQHQADQRAASDPSLDSYAQREAAERLGKATPVTTADAVHLAPSVLWIAFLLGCNIAAVRFGWRAKPETEAEQQARLLVAKAAMQSAAARKAHETRRANQANGGLRAVAS